MTRICVPHYIWLCSLQRKDIWHHLWYGTPLFQELYCFATQPWYVKRDNEVNLQFAVVKYRCWRISKSNDSKKYQSFQGVKRVASVLKTTKGGFSSSFAYHYILSTGEESSFIDGTGNKPDDGEVCAYPGFCLQYICQKNLREREGCGCGLWLSLE